MGDDFDIEQFLLQEALLGSQDFTQDFVEEEDLSKADYYRVIWPNSDAGILNSWLKQTITYQDNGIGIIQQLNGPCGVLAVLQGVLISNKLKEKGGFDPLKTTFSDDDLVHAILTILYNVKTSDVTKNVSNVSIALWESEDSQFLGEDIKITECTTKEQAFNLLKKNLRWYRSPGGIVLFLYSLVLTKGVDLIKSEITQSGAPANASLVEEVNSSTWFCSSELMSLLLRGTANGNLAAYAENGVKLSNDVVSLLGILSYKEAETRIPLTDSFKFPETPVWIFHTGDHFTTAFIPSIDFKSAVEVKESQQFELFHWNGLKPNGPKLTRFVVRAKSSCDKAKAKFEPHDFVPLPGEIEDVVQSDSKLKEKYKYDVTKWRFEVVLAVKDDTVSGPKRPENMKEFKFNLGPKPKGNWRCANCYRNRHKTYNFGENKVEGSQVETADECKFCGMSKTEAQWSLWLGYEQLPPVWQRRVTFYHGPKFLTILRTRWPACDVLEPKELESLFKV